MKGELNLHKQLHLFGTYHNSLHFHCENIFLHRKHTKIFYTNKFYNCNFSDVGWLRATHQHFPNWCCPYSLVYVVASNTTSNLLFTSHIFSTQCDLLNECPPATVKSIWSVRKLFYANIFFDETKKQRIMVICFSGYCQVSCRSHTNHVEISPQGNTQMLCGYKK